MLIVFLALCAMVATFMVARLAFAKTRLIEKSIDETIARKLAMSPVHVELVQLREENGVMRNLIRDMVENEASLSGPAPSSDDETRAVAFRSTRRREIFGEALFLLGRPSDHGSSVVSKIRG